MIETSILNRLQNTEGVAAVSTNEADLAASSHDTWPMATKWNRQNQHPYQAEAVVRATSEAAIATVLRIASENNVPVTVRALGSSVTGQPLPTQGGIVLDISGLVGEPSIDEIDMTVTAPAGNNGGRLEETLNARGWTTRFSPQSLYRSSIGGWVATLATGQFSSRYGGIEDMVVGYRVILADGNKFDLKASPRAAMGPDLRRLFIGSEGTLGVVTLVTFRIFPIPETQQLQALELPDIQSGLDVMRKIMACGLKPLLIRFYDTEEARHTLADDSLARPVLFLGAEGQAGMVDAEMQEMIGICTQKGGRIMGPAPVESWMQNRFDFSSIEKHLRDSGGFAETIEIAHTWRHIADLHATLKKALAPLADDVFAHFSHAYTQGTSLYLILRGQVEDDKTAIQRLEKIWATSMCICLKYGAELSHHHGGGLARSPYASRSLGPSHDLLKKLKGALDPNNTLNPGKLGL